MGITPLSVFPTRVSFWLTGISKVLQQVAEKSAEAFFQRNIPSMASSIQVVPPAVASLASSLLLFCCLLFLSIPAFLALGIDLDISQNQLGICQR